MIYYLIGFKSCGKSSIGKELAGLLDRPFFDLDDLIEQAYAQRTGRQLPFREIYKEVGADAFRRMEADALKSLNDQNDPIVSLGGGTPIDPQNQQVIKSTGRVIYISVDPGVLFRRICAGGIPATFDPEDPRGSFDHLLSERQPIYTTLAEHTLDATHLTIPQAAQAIAAIIAPQAPH